MNILKNEVQEAIEIIQDSGIADSLIAKKRIRELKRTNSLHGVNTVDFEDDFDFVEDEFILDMGEMTEVGLEYFFEQDSLENANMVPTYSDLEGGNYVRSLCGFNNTHYMGFVK